VSHLNVLHDSFSDNIGRLDQRAQDEIGSIVRSLEGDAFFEPDESNYLFERDKKEGICTCRHINHWGDWQLSWFYEYSRQFSSTIECVIVILAQEPLQSLRPKSKGANRS